MKFSKFFLTAALLIGIGGAFAGKAHANKNTTFWVESGGVCSSTMSAPSCPGAQHVICTIAGVTYFGTSANCGTALLYTP